MNDRLNKVQPRSTYIITLTAMGNHKAIVGPFTRVEKDRVVDALAGGIGYSVEQITTEVPEWARQSAEYRCLDCGAEFSNAVWMNNHIDTQHPEGYGADVKEGSRQDIYGYESQEQRITEGCPHCGRVLGVSNGVPVCDNCGWTQESDDVAWEDEYVDEDIHRGER